MNSNPKAATVSELVAHIKETLEETYHEVMVEGEMTAVSMAHSGHCYFNLVDSEAGIACVLFKQDLLRHPGFKRIQEGDRVLVYGPLSVYQKRGTFQIMVKRIMPAGEGLWKQRFEALKKKLSSEGLFDQDRKKVLPRYPRRIALVTAPGGAAVHDFLNVYQRRSFGYSIAIVPALVQGEKAPASLIAAIDKVEAVGNFDVVVITRGGGSAEDLWCFNDEALIRRLSRCQVPVVSAIGHEVDWTLTDYVADLRSETPTAAAEILSQPQTQVMDHLHKLQQRLRHQMQLRCQSIQVVLSRSHPQRTLGVLRAKFQSWERRLESSNLRNRAHLYLPVAELGMRTDELWRRCERVIVKQWEVLKLRVHASAATLEAVNPRAVLSRGYSLVYRQGKLIDSAQKWKQLSIGEAIAIKFHDGDGLAHKLEGESR